MRSITIWYFHSGNMTPYVVSVAKESAMVWNHSKKHFWQLGRLSEIPQQKLRHPDSFVSSHTLVCLATILSPASLSGISPPRFCHSETRWIWCWDDLKRHLSGNKPARYRHPWLQPKQCGLEHSLTKKTRHESMGNSCILKVESMFLQRRIQVS